MAEQLDILVKGCKKGNSRSQEKLYNLFSAAMYGLCLRYASNEDDAKDILQDGFVKVFQKIDQVTEPKAFPGWIRRVIINTALEKYRSQVLLQRIDESHLAMKEEVSGDVLDQLNAETLVDLIKDLSPKYRMVFNLYAIEGYSHKEVGEMLEISEGTSKSNLSRARVVLQEKVKKLYGTVDVR